MVNYAKEYGIDLEKLKQESPDTPDQMIAHRNHERRSAEYWQMSEKIRLDEEAKLRHALTAYHENLANARREMALRGERMATANRRRSLAVPKRKTEKLVKPGKHKFTEKQLEIAIESLNKKPLGNK